MHQDKCPCEECLRGKVALWKAFAGKPITAEDMEGMFRDPYSSHMYVVPLSKRMGPLNYVERGAFGWGR